MTHTAHPQTTTHLSDTARHWLTIPLTVIGIVAAVVGAWLAYGPGDATINFMWWTWDVADLSDLWAPWLMIGGGLVAAVSAGWETVRDETRDHPGITVLEGVIVLGGVAAMVIGLLLLF